MLKKIIEYIIGILFIFSAFTKLYDFSNTIIFFISITGLDFDIIKIGIVALSLLEIAIGISFFINTWNKQIIFYSIISLLSVFIFLNLYFLLKGYSNCGCFGTQIVSSPLVSLFKNIIITVYLLYAHYSRRKLNLVTQ